MSREFFDVLKKRRTLYTISKETTGSDEVVKDIIEKAVLHTPSAFNSQTARLVVLWRDHHDRLWDITRENLRKIVPADSFESTDEKITSFQNGYATVLYFEDQEIIRNLQESFPLYSQNFPVWSQQSSGMHQ